MITWYNIMASSDIEWLKSLLKTDPPAGVRVAALRLYALGEKDLALNTILEQMNQYKDPATPMTPRVETCPNAALDLGRLGDLRAIPDLIEAMDVYTFNAAFSLSLLDGEDLKRKLKSIANLNNPRGIGAILALGLMCDVSVLPHIADIVRNMNSYEDKYFAGQRIPPWISYEILFILGNYNNAEAEQIFLEELTRYDISHLIKDYAFEKSMQAYKNIRQIGWRIVNKFGWNKYLNNPETIKMLMDGNRLKWEKEENELIDLIWEDIRRLKEHK